MTPIRSEVVEQLAEQMLNSIDRYNFTPNELVSAIFTLAMRVCKSCLHVSTNKPATQFALEQGLCRVLERIQGESPKETVQ